MNHVGESFWLGRSESQKKTSWKPNIRVCIIARACFWPSDCSYHFNAFGILRHKKLETSGRAQSSLKNWQGDVFSNRDRNKKTIGHKCLYNVALEFIVLAVQEGFFNLYTFSEHNFWSMGVAQASNISNATSFRQRGLHCLKGPHFR